MGSQHRVVWSQGMLMQPQHFQQQARFVEALLDARLSAAAPHGWGFAEIVLDEGLLAAGSLTVSRARGVLPDGTPFAMPGEDALPPPFAVPADLQSEVVYLALPRSRIDTTEVSLDHTGDAPATVRFVMTERDVRDQVNASDDPEPVQLAAPALRWVRQRDLTDAFVALGVARIVERRADGQLVLDRGYIASQTRIDASSQLSATATLLHGLVQQRARNLASTVAQPKQGVSEVSDFLMLQLFNRYEPLLRQAAGAPTQTPWQFHQLLAQFAGELATFMREDRHPPEYPLYRHDDLQASFHPLIQDIRTYLSIAIERRAVQIELTERTHGVRTAVVADTELMRSADFVLAVRAQMPTEHLRERFPLQSKLGPRDRLRDLVNHHLPGVVLRPLPSAPRQLPNLADNHYFQLVREGELWKQLERDSSLALHVGGDFPGLELELWAIRSS